MKNKERECPGLYRYATCEWFYHPPRKQPDVSDSSQPPLPPTSQIPGLSDLAEPHNELMFESHRKWIRDSDSEYVKLSKQGGRPDLLKQYTSPPRRKSPVPYSRPDWFTDEWKKPPEAETQIRKWYLPDYMVYDELNSDQSDSKYKIQKEPHAENKTVQQRGIEESEKEDPVRHQVKLPAIKQKTKAGKGTATQAKFHTSTVTKGKHLVNTRSIPTMSLSKHNEPPQISKLISNGYVERVDQQRKEWEKRAHQQVQAKVVTKGYPPLSEYQEKIGQKHLGKPTLLHQRKAAFNK